MKNPGADRTVKENSVETDSLVEDAVADLLKSDLDPMVRRVLEIRLACSKSSTAKLTPMVVCRIMRTFEMADCSLRRKRGAIILSVTRELRGT